VHLPGLVTAGLPRTYRPPRVTPPDRLIHAHQGKTGAEAVQIGHEEEEECVFFVGLSRARDHLFIYSYSRQDDKTGPQSFTIPRTDPAVLHASTTNPVMVAGPGVASQLIPVGWDAKPTWNDSEIQQFDRCPRRFFL